MVAILVGVFLAKLLSIAGVGGFLVGLFFRSYFAIIALGTVLGIIDCAVLNAVSISGASPLGWIMAIIVGILMASLGWWLRGRKLNPKVAQ